jgi:hypothetical protein
MNETSIVGIVLAVIGILKGKDIWEFFKHRADVKSKSTDKVIEVYEKQLTNCETKVQNLEIKNEQLAKRFESKLKSRGAKRPEDSSASK